MTTTYTILNDTDKQLNPSGSCFYDKPLPHAAYLKKIEKIKIKKS